MLEHNGAEIQILDLPGIIEGAAEGKGRGRQVISTAKVRSGQVSYCCPSCFSEIVSKRQCLNANLTDVRQVIWFSWYWMPPNERNSGLC